jgi:hypothetical protein
MEAPSTDQTVVLLPGPPNQCLLTEVGGNLRVNDWNNGSFIDFNPGLLQWEMNVSAGKRAETICLQ